ncbi:MAG TPA: DUF6599 family protein [Candidatus Eisenbacteria bacterium]|nr:DUF6599 family protein [Candidatus Eisenbacteria bacterium]
MLCAGSVAADTSLLPNQFGSWQAEAPAKAIPVQNLGSSWAALPNVNYVLKEAGLQRIEERTYRNGADEMTLRTFVLQDPSSAYELYTFLLTPDMKDLGVGKDSAGGPDSARFLVGNLVVVASSPATVKPDGLRELLPALQAKADPTPMPPLKSYLPEHWRVFGSEKYALGPEAFRSAMAALKLNAAATLSKEVGFENGVEAILADFRGQHGSGTLLLLEYPTPQLAEQRLHHLEQALPESFKRAGVTIERKASMLSLVFAATSAEHAQAIRDEVRYETEVTWNEPGHTATDPPMVLIMFKIFVFTGLFLGIATAVGVAFGGLRVIIKRFFPGKVFDRPENIEVLQLGLSGKKIDPSDMY